jgi:HAD superfamily hydrolase (TIGR01509 family)
MDGLLLDTERLAMQALGEAGREIGVAMPVELCRSLIGIPEDASRAVLLEAHGSAATTDRLLAAATRLFEAAIQEGRLGVKPGALLLLDAADRAGLPRAVATSSLRRKAILQLQAAGIAERFDAVVTRDDVARGKPHPDVYLQAAQALGMAPSRCLALEDSYNGVRAAHAAGMSVVMVPDLLPPTEEMVRLCRAVVADLGSLVPWLDAHPPSER